MPSPPSPYIWLPDLQRYRDTATGRFVSSGEVRGWGQTSMNDSADHARGMAGALAERDITLGQWERNMRDQIKEEYIKQYLLGRGGRDLMTAEDWGYLGGTLANQYNKFLNKFSAEIAAGNLTEAQIAARSEMYLLSSRQAFERARAKSCSDIERQEERWVVDPGKENCPDCLAFQDEDWQAIGYFPLPGAGYTQCLSRCGCFKEYR